MKMRLIAAAATLLCCKMLMAENDPVTQGFDAKYLAWRKFVNRPEVLVQSTAQASIENAYFDALVAIGPSALPLIAAKIEEDPSATVLWHAIEKIAKIKIAGVYDQSKNRIVFPDYPMLKTNEDVYVLWWKEGRFKTGERFADLFAKWCALKSDSKDEESKTIYKQIVDLGLPVLPYLVDAAKQRPEFIPAISALADGSLVPTASPGECMEWWNKNRQKFELPPMRKNKTVQGQKDELKERRDNKLDDDEKGFMGAETKK